MKYPQLVSMPSTVQDWLDEQLEARGIDAVVYTRYILSLLQRDTLDIPDDSLTCTSYKAKEVWRRGPVSGRKRLRREENWNTVWDCEQLKRSAAVECLMSASDQKCGIEKLVDDLCMKLKEIEGDSKQSSVYLELSKSPKLSSQETLMPSQSPQDQAQKYYAAFPPLNSKGTDQVKSVIASEATSVWSVGKKILVKETKNCMLGGLPQIDRDIFCHSWEEDKENLGSENCLWKEVDQDNNNLKLREHLQGKFQPYSWNMAGSMNESYDELNSLSYEPGNERSEATPRRLYQRQADSPVGDQCLGVPSVEDKNLAQLIAKFDENIEALWSPTEVDISQSSSEAECIQDVPVDIQQLLSTPDNCVESKQSSGINSFISCGTNITSSIWSEGAHQSPNDEEICQSSEALVDLLGCDSNAIKKTEDVTYCRPGKKFELLFKCLEKPETDNRPDKIFNAMWNDKDTWPSFFSSLPYGLGYALGDLPETSTNRKWSDFGGSNLLQYSTYATANEQNCMKEDRNLTAGCMFMTLNHKKEESSFTEVIPKLLDGKQSNMDTMMESLNANFASNSARKLQLSEGEDEDLLTSARTHFKPIKQENVDSQNGSIRGYADGTTFIIPNGLEMLPFKRSQSGTLYLESEERLETPAKYREFKEKEPYGGRCNSLDDFGFSMRTEFIPKFKICRNEKFCQTEEFDNKISKCQFRSEVYFDDMDGYDDDDEEEEEEEVMSEDDCHKDTNNVKNDSKAWREELKVCYKCKDWKIGCKKNNDNIWSVGPGIGLSCQDCDSTPGLHYNRLREELSQDGEQLLSDLSYMQHLFLGSDWLEDGREQPMSGWLLDQEEEEDGNQPSAQKFQCISPMCDIIGNDHEMVMYADDNNCSRSLPGKHLAREEIARTEAKSVDDFFSKYLLCLYPKNILLAAEMEAEWKLNERPFPTKVGPKDRKRRHSASQRIISQELASGVTLRAHTSCFEGITCPQFILSHVAAMRPVTL